MNGEIYFMNWNLIKDEKDIDGLMEFFHGFHDSCIKELKYISGAYVLEDRSMHPLNEMADLSIIFQSQFCVPSIEMVFQKVNKFNLRPEDPQIYSCELLGANIEKIGDYYYWSNEPGNFDPQDYSDEITWVSCKNIKWRRIPDCFGDNKIYKSITLYEDK